MRISSNEICNGCRYLDFAGRKCTCEKNSDRFLSFFKNAEGFVAVIPNATCRRKYFEARKKLEKSSNRG